MALALRCLRNSSFSPISWRSSTRPSSLPISSVIAVSIATLSPIACISGSARPTRLAHSTSSAPISRIGGSKVRTSNRMTALAVCCIWSMASSIAVIRFLMSPRSNGVMKVRRTAVSTSRVMLSASFSNWLTRWQNTGVSSPPRSISCNACAPCTTVWACRSNRSKNRSSLGKKARNQRSIGLVHRSGTAAEAARYKTVIDHPGGKRATAGPGNPVIHRFVSGKTAVNRPGLQRAPEIMRDLANHAAAEGQHAGDEDHALNHRHPLAETGQILLHGDDHEGADHRTEYRAETADQRHQHDFARHRPVHVGERGVLCHEHFQRTGEAGDGAGEDIGQELVLVGLVTERNRPRLVLADRLQDLAEWRVDGAVDQQEAAEESDQDDVIEHRGVGEVENPEQLPLRNALDAVFTMG